LYKETFVLKKTIIQAQFSPFFRKLYVFEMNFMTLKIGVPT